MEAPSARSGPCWGRSVSLLSLYFPLSGALFFQVPLRVSALRPADTHPFKEPGSTVIPLSVGWTEGLRIFLMDKKKWE